MPEEIVVAAATAVKPAQTFRRKNCVKCGIEFAPGAGAQKFCELHKTPEKNTDERRAFDAEQFKHRYESGKEAKQIKAAKPGSNVGLKEVDAKQILATRIVNSHIIDVAYALGEAAAEHLKITANAYFWTHGLQHTINKTAIDIQHDQIVDSEVIHRGDLYAIWDYSVSWRESDVTFEDFVAMRDILKSDWFALGQFIGIPFEEKPHRAWQQFLPQFTPDGLKPGYSQGDMKSWLARQKSPTHPTTTREYLLMASRNTMKSTASLCLGACAVLCAPSIRILLISETTKLSKDFIKLFRGLWERGSNPAYERFQNYFPEYCIEPGDGKQTEFTSPMRGFVLPQETAEVASLETSVAGRRADLQLYDDVISNLNTANDDQRRKGLRTFYALTKLREAGSGLAIVIGTAWVTSPGGSEAGDLYFELLKNNDQDPEHPMAVFIQPAMVLKPDAQYKLPDKVLEITEDDVEELTCPSRWSFRELMREARKDIQMFLSQNLVMYVESEESKIKIHFEEHILRDHVRQPNNFDQPKYRLMETILAVDVAYGLSRYADFSALCIGKIYQDTTNNRYLLVIADMIMDRLRPSELAEKFVTIREKHNPGKCVIEKQGSWQNLETEIHKACQRRGIPRPFNIFWKPTTGQSVKNKVGRVKGIETLLNNDQFYILHAAFTESLIQQFIRFDGLKGSGKSNNSKDDGPDAAGMCAESSWFLRVVGDEEPSEAQQEMEQALEIQRIRRAQYERTFGNQQLPSDYQSRYQSVEDPSDEQNKLYSTLGQYGFTRKAA